MLLRAKEAGKRLGVCYATLRNRAESGKMTFFRRPGGERLYYVPPAPDERLVCYCRAFRFKTPADFAQHKKRLEKAYPGAEIVSDSGIGMRGRPNLFAVLTRALAGEKIVLIVDRREIRARADYDIAEWVLSMSGGFLYVAEYEGDLIRGAPLAPEEAAERKRTREARREAREIEEEAGERSKPGKNPWGFNNINPFAAYARTKKSSLR